jgi:hypothetical protein
MPKRHGARWTGSEWMAGPGKLTTPPGRISTSSGGSGPRGVVRRHRRSGRRLGRLLGPRPRIATPGTKRPIWTLKYNEKKQ